MAISGIGNSGFTPQQPLFELRSAEKQGAALEQSGVQLNREAQSGQVGAGGKTADEKQRIQQQVQQLKAQEEKIKAHEASHKAAGGQYASSATYTYSPGPDGRSYIVAGEVQIDMSPGRTPQETIAKMQIVQRAALAPGDPSGQDRAVAAQAAAVAAQAQQEQLKQANGEQLQGAATGSAGQKTKQTAVGNATVGGIDTNEPAGPQSHGSVNGKTEEVVAAVKKTQQESDIRQITSYKANTTPGDIFVAPKMSIYA